MLKSLSIGGKYVISRFWTHSPIILTHSVTSACNCRCRICNIWKKKPNANELTAREIFRMLDEAKRLNFVAYVAWGGEPLLRPDIVDILSHAHHLGFYTSIITNGTLLKGKAEEIAKVVDLTWVSLDYDSEYHSEIRGFAGNFGKTMEGIRELKLAGGRVAVNCVLSRLNIDAVGKMGELAKKHQLKLSFDPMEVFPGSNEEYGLAPSQRKKMFSEVADLKEKGYPILNSYEYARNQANLTYSCAQPFIFLDVSEDGKIRPFWCQRSNKTLGDLRKQSLNEIIHSSPVKDFAKISQGCCICTHATAFETSIFYSAQRFFANVYRLKNPYLRFIVDFALT
jgi:MoaA/NifB/PqqE/SkfB family radical SAM enzyme